MTPKELTLEEKIEARLMAVPKPDLEAPNATELVALNISMRETFAECLEIVRAHEAERKAKLPTEGGMNFRQLCELWDCFVSYGFARNSDDLSIGQAAYESIVKCFDDAGLSEIPYPTRNRPWIETREDTEQ